MITLTDDDKVEIMFQLRKLERPDLVADGTADRIDKLLYHDGYTYHDAMLMMFNRRFGSDMSFSPAEIIINYD